VSFAAIALCVASQRVFIVVYFVIVSVRKLLHTPSYSCTHSLTSALDGGEWSASHPGRLTPRERAPGIHWIGGWVGPSAVLDAVILKRIFGTRGRKWQETGEDCIMRGFITCTYHQILL
jgi:hypothetical protein